MSHVETPSIKQRLGAVISAGVLAASTMAAPMVALAADDIEPSVGNQTGTGATEVTVQLLNDDKEIGGTEDPNNPDTDPADGLGDNLAFTVPSAINFVAKSDGTLTGPSPAATYIENESVFSIHGSSSMVENEGNWHVVADAGAASESNAVDFKYGPAADQLDAATYLGEKKAVGDMTKWNMNSKKANYVKTTDTDVQDGKTYYTLSGNTYTKVASPAGNPSTQNWYEDNSVIDDRVQWATSGHIANVTDQIQEKTHVATIHTYVTPGIAS